MESFSLNKLCEQLISLAIQRCRLSGDPSRISVLIRQSSSTDLPLTQISISDTGAGSCLKEFQDLQYIINVFFAPGWDGVLSITTTGINDSTIFHYTLNAKENDSNRRLIKLAPTPKNNAKFSGTEVSMSTTENMQVIVAAVTALLRKMLILKIHNIAIELVTVFGDPKGVQQESVVLTSELTTLPLADSSNIGELTRGLEEYVHKHANDLTEKCQSCFSISNNLKVGNGLACSKTRTYGELIVEAVIIISDVVEPATPSCLKAFEPKTKVLYFRDFTPCSSEQSDLNLFSSLKWSSYGLSLTSITDDNGSVILEWETLPQNTHIDVALHCYNKQYPSEVDTLHFLFHVTVPPLRRRAQLEKKLVKKSVGFALDDLKEKYYGVLLSARALKIQSYAPDLAKSIAGLILSSTDLNFKDECLSILGLESEHIKGDSVEKCVKDKIICAIDMNDSKPPHLRSREDAPFLFGDGHMEEPEYMYDEYKEGEEEGHDFMDF